MEFVLIDEEAVDISRMTGVPWYFARVATWGGHRPCIGLVDLTWWDRWKVLWARVGANYWLRCDGSANTTEAGEGGSGGV
jgi:hypothetical protein